ncbi:hypothetical protein WR25_19945 [Diploscapter pachys]|uniref:Uncharacterized protein n=1 Tax=Diploscapter pachys TaxID=2018661 RepID=A0A2A2L1L7_9BILA|nr:hypothetical protein WR25_19945 [Diploscapter pachys]
MLAISSSALVVDRQNRILIAQLHTSSDNSVQLRTHLGIASLDRCEVQIEPIDPIPPESMIGLRYSLRLPSGSRMPNVLAKPQTTGSPNLFP